MPQNETKNQNAQSTQPVQNEGIIWTEDDIQIIDELFEGWAGPVTAADGFVNWAWDVRAETLAFLNEDPEGQLVSDIQYTVLQKDRVYNLPDWLVTMWLDENRDDLKEALEDSLAED